MTRNKRNRSDGAAGRQEIVSGALSPIPDPPEGVKISPQERPFWDAIIDGKARRAWTEQDKIVAGELARVMYRVEYYSETLATYEGVCKESIELEKLLDSLRKSVRMLSIYLQIHPEATQGKSREQIKQNKAHGDVKQPVDDDLIARPSLQ